MTNFEWLIKEKTELAKDLLTTQNEFAAYGDGSVKFCYSLEGSPCDGCIFYRQSTPCPIARRKWLEAEHNPYTIPLDTPVDTRVLVSGNGENWTPRHFAGFGEDVEHPYLAFREGVTSWTNTLSPFPWKYCKLA